MPLFFRIYIEGVFNETPAPSKYHYYKYKTDRYLFHLQYYGQTMDFSFGYSVYKEVLKETEYENDNRYIGSTVIKEKDYKGGGITVNYKNILKKDVSIFGEIDILSDNKQSVIITKVGTKFLLN